MRAGRGAQIIAWASEDDPRGGGREISHSMASANIKPKLNQQSFDMRFHIKYHAVKTLMAES